LRGLGAEIAYDRGKGRYEYKGDAVTLPAQWLTDREFAILLIAERALRVHAGLPFYNEIHPVFNKLINPVRHDEDMMDRIREMCRGVVFHRPFETGRNVSREFGRILQAIMDKQAITFFYTPVDGKKTDREADPYVLLNDGGDWYLIAHCRLRNAVRTFALDRIFNTKKADRYFAIPKSFKIDEYLEKGFGRMRGGEAEDVKLLISGRAVSWVERNQWHPTQKTDKKDDGSLALSMKCPVTDSLVRWVIQMAGDVKVVSPDALREKAVAAAKGLLERNK
jgi:predicted DNA-binding transcriptional regulator YafY